MNKKIVEIFPWSLAIAIGSAVFFASFPDMMYDLRGMRDAQNTLNYYHPLYARWLFMLLSVGPLQIMFLLLAAVSIASLYFSLRVYGGRHWMVFVSYQLLWLYFYGQIDGIIIGGLTLAYYAIERKRPVLAGLGIAIAMIKPQMSAFMILLFLWWSPSKWKTLTIPTVMILLSFIQWGFWIPEWLNKLFGFHDIFLPTATNISVWPITGPWVLLIWPFLALLPIDRKHRLIAFAAGTMMSVPYFPIYSSLLVLPMQIPVLVYVIFQTAFLKPLFQSAIFDFLRVVPVILLAWALYKGVDWKNLRIPWTKPQANTLKS